MEEGPFDPKAHKVDDSTGKVQIDGKPTFGVEFYPPKTQIKSIQLKIAGKEIDVPKSLYDDCFNFGLDHREETDFGNVYGLVVRALPDGAMLMSSFGSDGNSSYLVHWWIGGTQPAARSVVTQTGELFKFADYWHTQIPDRPAP